MPITTLLARGTVAAASNETIVNDGVAATLTLLGEGTLTVEVKNSEGVFRRLGELSSANPVRQVFGPMTFQVRRELVAPKWAGSGQPPVTDTVGASIETA